MSEPRNLEPAIDALSAYLRHSGMDEEAAITDLIVDLLHLADERAREDAEALGGGATLDRVAMHYEAEAGEDDAHEARPDDLPEPGDRCKDCGKAITWTGPSHLGWEHVETEEAGR